MSISPSEIVFINIVVATYTILDIKIGEIRKEEPKMNADELKQEIAFRVLSREKEEETGRTKLTIYKEGLYELIDEFDENQPIVPKFVDEYYKSLEWPESEEFLMTDHVLRGVFSNSYTDDIEEIAQWIKEYPSEYVFFSNTVSNGGSYKVERFYAVFDSQIGGFKAGMAYDSYDEAREGILDRIYNIHTDFYESDGYDSWDEFMEHEDYSEQDLIDFQGYEVQEVSSKDYYKILDSEDYGLLTSVNLTDK